MVQPDQQVFDTDPIPTTVVTPSPTPYVITIGPPVQIGEYSIGLALDPNIEANPDATADDLECRVFVNGIEVRFYRNTKELNFQSGQLDNQLCECFCCIFDPTLIPTP